jgi:hypothetical protein
METRTRPPIRAAGASLLEQLQLELLEKIMLEVMDDVASPITYDEDWKHVLRCCAEISTGTSIATLLLAHRLVSCTLRDSSWKSLAKVIGETIFDLRSKDSVENLAAVTECPQLVPWVQKLTVSCFTVDHQNGFPHLWFVRDGSRRNKIGPHLPRAKAMERLWYPLAWRWAEDGSGRVDSVDGYSLSPQDGTEALVALLGKCLRSLHNLSSVNYHYEDNYVPGRYRLAAGHLPGSFSVDETDACDRGAWLGQFMLLEALAIAQTELKSLEISVTLGGPHWFELLSTNDTVLRVLQSVQTLTLRDELAQPIPGSPASRNMSVVTLARTCFPNLRSLTLEAYTPCILSYDPFPSGLPETIDVPRLADLTIIHGRQSDELFLGFLRRLKDSVRSVTLNAMQGSTYEPILEVLKQFGLDKLTIYDKDDKWWGKEEYVGPYFKENGQWRRKCTVDKYGFRGVPKGLLEGFAKEVNVGPLKAGEEFSGSNANTATEQCG